MDPNVRKAQSALIDAEAELKRRTAKASEVEAALSKAKADVARLEGLDSVTTTEVAELENARRRQRALEAQLGGVNTLVEQQASEVAIAKKRLADAVHGDAQERLDKAERELMQRARLLEDELRMKLEELRQLASAESKAAIAAGTTSWSPNRVFLVSEQALSLKSPLELCAQALARIRDFERGPGKLPERYRHVEN